MKPNKNTMVVWDGFSAREIDSNSQKEFGIDPLELMEEAGTVCFQTILEYFSPQRPYLILVGPGNNGGDGLVIGRKLYEAGIIPQVVLVGTPKKQSLGYSRNLQYLLDLGLSVANYEPTDMNLLVKPNTVIIDAILGVGLKHPLQDSLVKTCIEELAQYSHADIIAIDMPSGMSCDQWYNHYAVKAKMTITFGSLKPCHVLEPSRSYCGKIIVKELPFPEECIDVILKKRPKFLSYGFPFDETCSPLNDLSSSINKFERGHVLVIGGSAGKLGAPILAGSAALSAGCGWLTLALPSGSLPLSGSPIEATYEDFFKDEKLDYEALESFVAKRKVTSIVIGPGMSPGIIKKDGLKKFWELQNKYAVFLTFDAGALFQFFDLASGMTFNLQKTVLTPHPGEFLRLENKPRINGLNELDDLIALYEVLLKQGVSMAYKSSPPLIIPGSEDLTKPSFSCIGFSDSSFAKAGMGDTLAGLVSATGPFFNCASKAIIHAFSVIFSTGLKLKSKKGSQSLLPSDIVANIGRLQL